VVYEETLVEQEALRLDDDAFDGGDCPACAPICFAQPTAARTSPRS
jgi:hypothetical protein